MKDHEFIKNFLGAINGKQTVPWFILHTWEVVQPQQKIERLGRTKCTEENGATFCRTGEETTNKSHLTSKNVFRNFSHF